MTVSRIYASYLPHKLLTYSNHAGPYLFMSCSLVAEDYDEQAKGADVPSNYLTGSLVSSVHRLKDSSNNDGGFFIFGDLSVKQEGRFRLRFTLYDKDERTEPPSFFFVSEIISNCFTVYSPKNFPGMSESTFLTRTFSDQGVKLRLRKDSRALTTRKRNRNAADSTESLLGRQIKRTTYDAPTNLGSFAGLNQMISPGGTQGLTGMPGPPGSQAHMSTSRAGSAMSARHPGTVLPLPTSGYYSQGYAQTPGQHDTTTAASFPTLPAYNNGYPTNYGMGQMLQQMPNPTGSPAQTYMSGFSTSTGRGMSSPYGIGSDQISQPSQDTTPRSLTMLGNQEPSRSMMETHSHEDAQRHMTGANGHYGGT